MAEKASATNTFSVDVDVAAKEATSEVPKRKRSVKNRILCLFVVTC